MKTSDRTDESRKDETCLQIKMNKHFIKTGKNLSINKYEISKLYLFQSGTRYAYENVLLDAICSSHILEDFIDIFYTFIKGKR